jgi:hypothetical protein
VYIVLSYPTKSTTLTSTDVGSLKNFQNGTKRRKARRISSNVRAYLFVHTHVHSLVVPNQKYDPHINRRRFPKKFSKWNRTPKGSSNFSNVRVHLFVSTLVAIVYRVLSCQTKSMTFTLTDIGSQKSFKKKWNRTPKGSLS